jgi:hypothetical protein
MPELKADLLPRLLIQVTVNAIAVAAIDRCGVARELFVTLAGVGRAQFVKAFKPLLCSVSRAGRTVCRRNRA